MAEREPKRAGAAKLTEFKHVTILFADVIESVAAIRDSDPEDAHSFLAPLIKLMSSSVNDYGGFVTRTLGDGIMAIFGAPAALEDHATRACHAALNLLGRCAEQGDRYDRINIRVGIHSGRVVVGTWQNDFTNDYDATGLTVAIASRVQSAAPHGRAAITLATHSLISSEFQACSLGLQHLKGLAEPIELFVLEEAATLPSSIAQYQTNFVGRRDSLNLLESEFQAACQSNGRVLLIVGEAGFGKTSLVTSFFSGRATLAFCARVSAERYRGNSPFHPIRDLILDLFGLTNADLEARQTWIASQVNKLETTDHRFESALYELFDAGRLPAVWDELDPKTKFELICACVRTIFTCKSAERPLLLVIEDLQRADSATVDLLGILSETLKNIPVLLIVTTRPSAEPAWAGRNLVRRIQLGPMHRREMVTLAANLLGTPAPPLLEKLLLAWSQGNPMFLKESIRGLTEALLIVREGSTLIVRDEIDSVEPPMSIRSIISERVDRLQAETKDLLLVASVLGDHFSIELLADITGVPASTLQAHTDMLQAANFIMQTGSSDFAFVHALFQEVCYATLLKRRRQSLHAAAFATLSATKKEGFSVEGLAFHAFNGGLWNEAFHYSRSAGRRAASRSSNRDAAFHLRRAAQALNRIDVQNQRLADAIDLKLALRTVLIPLLQLDQASNLLAEAYDLAHKIDDKRRLATIIGLQASHAYLTESPKVCLDLCGEALRLTSARAHEALRIAPNVFLGQALYAFGQFRRAKRVFGRALKLIARTPPGSKMGLTGKPRIVCNYWIAISDAEIGNFAVAEQTARHMLAGDNDVQPFERAYAEQALGFVLMTRGDFMPALEASQSALEIADKSDIPYMVPSLASQVGLLLALQGDAGRGLAMAQRGVEATKRIGVSSGRSRWIARLAEVWLLAGDPEEAARHADEAVQIARAANERAYLAAALRLRARVGLARNGALALAEADVKEAIALARKLSIEPLLAKCLIDLAEIEMRTDQHERARAHLQRSFQLFDAFGMLYWACLVNGRMASGRESLGIGALGQGGDERGHPGRGAG